MLLNIANTRSKTAYAVQTFLYLTKGHFYPIEIPDYTIPNGNKKADKYPTGKTAFSDFMPNPTNGISSLNYHIVDGETAHLNIYDVHGRLLQTQWLRNSGTYHLHTQSYQSGLYFYTININGQVVERNRLVIMK